jgi:serine/threonine protein kinase, bacterial
MSHQPLIPGGHRRTRAIGALLALGGVLVACGGGGGGGTPASPTYTVGGTVSGLRAGLSVTVADGSSRQQATLTANGSYSAALNVASGAAYSLSITTQPVGQLCSITNASGSVAAANVTTVAISCADSLTLLTDIVGLAFGMAADSAGNVYMADASDDVIYKITPQGVFSTLAGQRNQQGNADGTGAAARFDSPYGIAFETAGPAAGNLVVADTSGLTVRSVTLGGVVTTLAGRREPGVFSTVDGVGAAARFQSPTGIAVDGAGNRYVTEQYGNSVRKIAADGAVTTLAGSGDRFGMGSADGPGRQARFNEPIGIATDSAGNLFVADSGNHTIRKISPQGEVSTFAGMAGEPGSTDGTGSNARFNGPWGVVIDSTGNLYVTDRGNHTVRKISPQGVVRTVLGRAGVAQLSTTALPGGLGFPAGIALQGGRLFVNTAPNSVVWAYAP